MIYSIPYQARNNENDKNLVLLFYGKNKAIYAIVYGGVWLLVQENIEFPTLIPLWTFAIQYNSHNRFIDQKLRRFSFQIWDEYDYLPNRIIFFIYKISIPRLAITFGFDSKGGENGLEGLNRDSIFWYEKKKRYL